MGNSPSCASPLKPENSIALKPQTEVSTPSRSVGQIRFSVSRGASSGVARVKRNMA